MAGFQAAHYLGTLSVFSYTSPRATSPSASRLKTGGECGGTHPLSQKPAQTSSVQFPPATCNCTRAWVCFSVMKAGRNSFTVLYSIFPIRDQAGVLVIYFFSLAFWTETKCALVTLLTQWSMEYPFHTMHFLFASSFILTILWCRY